MRTLISYCDGSGEITEREISDIVVVDGDNVDAMCHLRNARRPFRVSRVLRAYDPDTGLVFEDLWKHWSLPADGLMNVVGPLLPAIRALKLFTESTRSLRDKERHAIFQFIARNSSAPAVESVIDPWLRKLWVRDEKPALLNLANVSAAARRDARATALQIAQGTGRRPISPDSLVKVDELFPRDHDDA